MSEKNTLQKGKRILQASPFDEWRIAPRPNYIGNTDLKFPYSEYPRNQPYEYYSVPLSAQQSSTQILDFWGEGRISDNGLITGFPGAYNVNHQFQLVSNGADRGKKIPNRIPTVDYATVSVEKYVPSGSFDIVTLMGAPITDSTAAEIGRIVSGDMHSMVVIYGFDENDGSIMILKSKLDSKELVLSPNYDLPSPLNEITIKPALTFRPINEIVEQAISYFKENQMDTCANILCSLGRSSQVQSSARKGLTTFFSDDNVKNNSLIFALGYKLNKTSDGQDVMNGYMNHNVVKIVRGDYSSVQFQSNSGSPAYLCVDGKVSSSQYSFFGTTSYVNENSKFVLTPNPSSNYEFQVQSNYGSTSYLCTESVGDDSYQYAFFNISSGIGNYGHYFRLCPVSGGEKFNLQAQFGHLSYLCVNNGSVSSGSWQWAVFSTYQHIQSNEWYGGYTFTLIFE